MALIGRGCKLDLTFVSALVERWRLETHMFNLPCSERTITLEDVQLWLGLLVDRLIVTRSIYAVDWRDVCEQLLEYNPSKFLVNPNIQHVNVPLVVYVIVEMYESDRVLRQFGFKQLIPPAPYDIKDLYPIDLHERTDENWLKFHAQFINIWNNKYEFLPTHEAIVERKLACYRSTCHSLGSMASHICEVKRQGVHNRIRGGHERAAKADPSSTPIQESTLMVAPPPVNMTQLILVLILTPSFLHKHHILHLIFLLLLRCHVLLMDLNLRYITH
ncbi:hypothetical protein PVK06_039982 [Gossypium arboreum]|uniref:Aminotransferase-like plant mobile domain-containing protein n=1 Tax=Gossypium arboreum TaxID=29729 RepID=A0ABR0N709_GOSAR|nr:hypothetical protein PVK06_039982 [Gossypium arboreum]